MALPEGYIPPKGTSRYMKFEDGSNKFQVLFIKGEPPYIWGWQNWTEENGKRKPIRGRKKEDVPAVGVGYNGEPSEPTFFWAMAVWKFSDNKVYILQFDKRSIQRQLEDFMMTEEWGSLANMSIEVRKSGVGRETRYVVIPMPRKAVPEKVQEEFEDLNVDLTKLYDGESPFTEEKKEPVKRTEEEESLDSFEEENGELVDDILSGRN